jgi:hypothetical protein
MKQKTILNSLTVFFKIMVWVADTHAVLGGFLCFLTAVVGVTACYMESLIVAIPLTFILGIYVLMIIIYSTMSRVDRDYLKDYLKRAGG